MFAHSNKLSTPTSLSTPSCGLGDFSEAEKVSFVQPARLLLGFASRFAGHHGDGGPGRADVPGWHAERQPAGHDSGH